MNAKRHIAVLALGIGFCLSGLAQAPASAPAGSTGVCNDGSLSTAASKSGACRGHKGVKTWYSAVDSAKPKAGKTSAASSAATPAPAAVTSPAAASAASTKPSSPAPKASTSNIAQAPGGGPGLVWVNSASNVYHCSGTQFYGKTKAGKYMTEAQAKSAGAHPDHGKGCGQ